MDLELKTDATEYAHNLVKLRKAAKMSRADLAAQCGVATSTFINYERGTRIPYADTAIKIARVFNTTVEEMFGNPMPEKQMQPTQGNTDRAIDCVPTSNKDIMYHDMFFGSPARRMTAIIDCLDMISKETVLTIEEVEDFTEEINKILRKLKQGAREKYIPKYKRTKKRTASTDKANPDAAAGTKNAPDSSTHTTNALAQDNEKDVRPGQTTDGLGPDSPDSPDSSESDESTAEIDVGQE